MNQRTVCYADNISITEAPVTLVEQVARDTYLIRVEAVDIASRTIPGQFVMIRFADRQSPLIGRALAVYDIHRDDEGTARWIDLIFVRKGSFTKPMSQAGPGTSVSLWGPLGNGFSDRPCDHLVIAVGGIGQTPMLLLAQEALGSRHFGDQTRNSGWARKVTMVYGARSADLLACVDQFRCADIDVHLCTDDGSTGAKARVPDYLFRVLDQAGDHGSTRVVTCGPEIMMEKVAEGCLARGIDCQVSMETPMACGIGICFSCVAKIRDGDDQTWDYKRTCVEGPIFNASELVW